jgi:hypothetical protein
VDEQHLFVVPSCNIPSRNGVFRVEYHIAKRNHSLSAVLGSTIPGFWHLAFDSELLL